MVTAAAGMMVRRVNAESALHPSHHHEDGEYHDHQWLDGDGGAEEPARPGEPLVQREQEGIAGQGDRHRILGVPPEDGHVPQHHGLGDGEHHPAVAADVEPFGQGVEGEQRETGERQHQRTEDDERLGVDEVLVAVKIGRAAGQDGGPAGLQSQRLTDAWWFFPSSMKVVPERVVGGGEWQKSEEEARGSQKSRFRRVDGVEMTVGQGDGRAVGVPEVSG